MPLMRHFLRSTTYGDGFLLLDAACVQGEPAAVQLLLVALRVRRNPRSRRTFHQVSSALQLAAKPRWLVTLARKLFALYSVLRGMSIPSGHHPSSAVILSRRQRRHLAPTGLVRDVRQSLAERAAEQATELHKSIVVLPRYCPHHKILHHYHSYARLFCSKLSTLFNDILK